MNGVRLLLFEMIIRRCYIFILELLNLIKYKTFLNT